MLMTRTAGAGVKVGTHASLNSTDPAYNAFSVPLRNDNIDTVWCLQGLGLECFKRHQIYKCSCPKSCYDSRGWIESR